MTKEKNCRCLLGMGKAYSGIPIGFCAVYGKNELELMEKNETELVVSSGIKPEFVLEKGLEEALKQREKKPELAAILEIKTDPECFNVGMGTSQYIEVEKCHIMPGKVYFIEITSETNNNEFPKIESRIRNMSVGTGTTSRKLTNDIYKWALNENLVCVKTAFFEDGEWRFKVKTIGDKK